MEGGWFNEVGIGVYSSRNKPDALVRERTVTALVRPFFLRSKNRPSAESRPPRVIDASRVPGKSLRPGLGFAPSVPRWI